MTTIAITRTKNGLPASAEAAYITLRDQPGNVLVDGELVDPYSPGYYAYQINTLGPGNYTVVWRFLIHGFEDDIITRSFTLDAPLALTDGITLMRIEQSVARRIGPYRKVTATLGSTILHLSSTVLKSRVTLGSYEDQYMLRRGITESGALIPSYDPDNRVRLVALYEPENGYLYNDREWSNAPDINLKEMVEIMYLDPDTELRPNVQDGLKRCFFWDTLWLQQTETAGAWNLTAAAPWLVSPSQINQVSSGYANSSLRPMPEHWWRIYRKGKDLYLWVGSMTASAGLMLDVLRPAYSLVNEENSFTGPNDDQDMVYVPLEYATWAGVIELWKNQPERLQPLIHEQLRADLKAAAAEFTKQSLIVANQFPDQIHLNFGQSDLASLQIGNLAEPRV